MGQTSSPGRNSPRGDAAPRCRIRPRRGFTAALFPAVLSALLALNACSRYSTVTETRIALGTYVKVTVVTKRGREEQVRRALEAGYGQLKQYERSFDYRSEDGELALFNRSAVLHRERHPQLYALVQDALRLARLTDGYFDPTILPVTRAWGFDTDNPSLPEQEVLDQALLKVGYRQVTVSDREIRKPLQVNLDLSGIAKGKIVDLLRDYLRDAGYGNFLIDAGGDIYVSGTRERGQPWRVAVQDPVHENRYRGVLTRSDTAIVTSGDYERFFMVDGDRFTHLFNPRTGYPDSDCRSVTVLSEDAAFGDAVATAVFVMGRERGVRFLKEHGIPGFILFDGEGGKLESLSTRGFWN